MTIHTIPIRELAAWGLDEYKHRPMDYDRSRLSAAERIVAQRSHLLRKDAYLESDSTAIQELLAPQALRSDLLTETAGYDWSLGVVDLRLLISFQRRIALEPSLASPVALEPKNWPALIEICFPAPKTPQFETIYEAEAKTLVFRSGDPNLSLRRTNNLDSPLAIHAGSPFFEVARYKDRWFLRDGYHRAYGLLRAGVTKAPALIINARGLSELGADRPWFFKEETLLSATPPCIVDYLDDALVLEYNRSALVKTLRVTIEELLEPTTSTGDSR